MAIMVELKAKSGYANDIQKISGTNPVKFSVNGVEYVAPNILCATAWLSENDLYQPTNKIVYDL